MASGDFLENESFEFPNYKPLDPVHTGNKPCIICNKPSIMPCPECQKFSYCSDKHQNLHFKTHQFDCLGRGILLAVPNSIPSHIKNKKSVDFNGFVEKDKKIVEKELRFIDTRVEKLIEEREKLRKELIASFTSLINEAKKGGSEGVLNLGQRLVKASYKLYEIANKADSREFYEYCADHLLLVRALIRYEQMRSARDNLILILPMVTRIVDRSEKFKEIAKTTDISSIEFINTDIDALGYHKKLLINNELKRRANLLSLLASGFYSVEDFKNCEMFFVKYLTLVEKSYGSKSLEMSNCYFMIGEFYYQLEQLPKALKSFKWSYEIRKGKLGEKHDSVGDCWYNLGVVYKNFNEPLKAFLLLEKALEQKRESKGELSLPCALVLEVQGKVLLEGGDYKASLVKLSDCYNIRKKLLNNAKHPELIRISLLLMHLSKLVLIYKYIKVFILG